MKLSLNESYAVLGLSSGATEEEAKVAYKRCAMKSHPDKNTHDTTAEFQQVSAAYDTINKHFKKPSGRTHSHPFQQYHSHGGDSDDEDDYGSDDDEYYDDDDINGSFMDAFAQHMFESMFRGATGRGGGGGGGGGGFSPDGTFTYTMPGYRHTHNPLRNPFEDMEPPRERDVETPEAYMARVKAEREAAVKAEERQKEDDRREKEDRERARVDEMNAGAARRESKLSAKKEKVIADKLAKVAKAAELLEKAQTNRSAVFAAARKGDSTAVKAGIWENNVGAGDVERIFGYLSPEEIEFAKNTKNTEKEDKEAVHDFLQNEHEVGKENVEARTTSNGKSKYKKKKKGKGGEASGAGAGPTTNGSTKEAANTSAPKLKGKSSKSNSNQIDEKETLLHISVRKGDASLSEWLVDHGATTEDRDANQFTPVHYAIQLGPLSLVEFFLSNNPLPNEVPTSTDSSYVDSYFPCPPGESLLSLAVRSNDPKIVELIVGSKLVTVDEGWRNWKFIEGLVKMHAKKFSEKEKEVFEEIKWAITEIPGFVAPAEYKKRRRVRT